MGSRGPKPKAAKQPKGDLGVPNCPTWIGADGKRWWKSLTGHMLTRSTITPQHREIIAMVCSSADIFHRANRVVMSEGITTESANGVLIQHPAVGTRNKAWDQITRGLRELGLTPTSWANVPDFKGGEDDPLAKFVGQDIAGRINAG